jgi:hypothetical protein
MDRKRFEQLLPDYIENNLSGSDLADFNAWISEHPGAREEIGALRGLILEVSDIEVPDPGSEFWSRFIPDLRTRMDRREEKLGIAERLRRVLLRPTIIGSTALATVILVLLALYSNMGPRGEEAMEARRINLRLEAALRSTEDDTLAQLEAYFGRPDPADETGAAVLAAGRPLAAVVNGSGDEWIENWLDLEENRLAAVSDVETYRLIGELTDEEEHRLAEMLRAELTSG